MALQSQLFGGDPQLEAAAVSDPAHIVPGARGPHVAKIQLALIQVDGATIAQDSIYGPATAAAVRAFKQKRRILNFQGQIDDIVGKKTMAALDQEVLARERGGGGGGLLLNFKFDPLLIPIDFKLHVLIYFSGVADKDNRGGTLLLPGDKVVLNDMTTFTPPQGDVKSVTGFGGSLVTQAGVEQAFAIIQGVRDRRGKLIIYGFSAGGVNSLALCRRLSTRLPNIKVDLLVTVDVAGGRQTPFLDRSVPSNVLLNKNYFQTFPSLGGSFGAPATGPGNHKDINLNS